MRSYWVNLQKKHNYFEKANFKKLVTLPDNTGFTRHITPNFFFARFKWGIVWLITTREDESLFFIHLFIYNVRRKPGKSQ